MKKIIIAAFIIATAYASVASALVAELPDDYQDDTKLYCPPLTQTLKRGARDAQTGGQVTELQMFLGDYFNLSENDIVSGFFGRNTQKYVIQFQQQNGLPAYGVAGSLTRAKIAEVCRGGEVIGTKKCVIGGCSGQLCIEEGNDAITTCEYREEYGCYKKHSTCARQATGQCGWTETATLKQCLNPQPKVCDRAAPPQGCYWKMRSSTGCDAELVCQKEQPTCASREVTDSKYFAICRESGFDNVCFNKDLGYQGCTRAWQNDCTVNNTNASTNQLCPVPVVINKRAFKASPDTGNAPLSVTFSAQAGDEEALSVDFGDGTSAPMSISNWGSSRAVSHVYQRPGTYIARLNKDYRCTATAGTVCLALASEQVGSVQVLVVGSITNSPVISETRAKAAGNFEMDAGGEASILGSHLSGNTIDTTKVVMNGSPVTVTYASDSLVNFKVPPTLTPGQTYELYVTNEKGKSNVVRVKILSAVVTTARSLSTNLISPGPVGSNSVYVSMKATGLTESAAPNAHIDWGDGTVQAIQCEGVSTTSYLNGAFQTAIAIAMPPQKCPAYGYMKIFSHNYTLSNTQPVFEYNVRIVSDYGEFARNPIKLWNGMPQVYNQ